MGVELPEDSYTRTHIRWQKPEPGWMELDAVLRQTVDHDGEVTEHPVDRDANITDHYRRITVPLTLETLITNSPLKLPRTHTGDAKAVSRISTVELPVPIFPGAPTSVGGFDITSRRVYTIDTLDFTPSSDVSGSSSLDRINLVYEELRLIQEQARLLSVHLYNVRGPDTGGAYDNMLLKRFQIDQDPSMANAVSLVLEFKQVILADVLTDDLSARLPKKPRSNPRGDGGNKGTDAKDGDKPTEERLKSTAKRGVDGVLEFFGG